MHTRDEVRSALDHNFKTLMDCLGQLTEEELIDNVVAGTWTAKDIIGHIWDWGDEALRSAKAWRGSLDRQAGVTDETAWNEAHVNARRGMALITVVDGVTGSHRRLVHFVDMAEDDQLAEPGRAPWGAEMPLGEMFYEMAAHYADHAEALARYQRRCLGDEDERKSVGCD